MPYAVAYGSRSAKGSIAAQQNSHWKAKPRAPRTMAGTDKQLVRRAAKQAAMALALAKATQKESEVKNYDGSFLDSSLASATVLHMTSIAGGNTNNTRIGDRIKVTRLQGLIKYTINYLSVMNGNFRTIIFQDKQQVAGTLPALTDLLDSSSTNSLYRVVTSDRFRVLYENRTTLNLNVADKDTTSELIPFDIKLPAGITVEYSNSGSGDIVRNGIYVVVFGDTSTIADPDLPVVGGAMSTYFGFRVHFEDL